MLIRGLSLPLATYRRRRARAAKLVAAAGDGPIPILFIGCDGQRLRADRQDPWFDYYCGCAEPDAALLIDPAGPARDTLFLSAGDPKRVVWDGHRLGPDEVARAAHGVHAVANRDQLRRRVEAAAKRAHHRLAMCCRDRDPGFQAEAFATWKRNLRGVTLVNVEPPLARQRMVKDADEIRWHRRAVAVTRAGFLAVLPLLPRLKTEAEIAAALLMHFRRVAFAPPAFPPIVGSAVNGATLHYPHNDQPLVRRAPVLIDAGATAGGYCADVTRTVPQHGRFDRRRFREVYELVLRANALGRARARPGITRDELNALAWRPITDAGFTRHHGLSHHLGLDVHDPATLAAPLAPGMVISNEPGVYLPDEGFGVRIEDDLLITRNGCVELSAAIPKSIADLEALMRG
jgi:Xaa-Pro aminopeptidase